MLPKTHLKIGFVLDDTLDKPDGVQQYILTLGQWLSEQGHEVHYLVGETKRSDVKTHSLSKNIKMRFNGNRMSIPLPANRVRIKAVLEAEQFDVLHIQVPYSPQLAARIISLAPATTAVIGTFHILPYSIMEKTGTFLLGLWLKRNGKRFDTMLSVSSAAQVFAKTWYGVDSQVLPNVVNMRQFKTRRPAKHNGLKIVFLGRLVQRKGCAELLEAVSLLPKPLKQQISVVIGGKGALQRSLLQQAERLGIGDKVYFMGFVDEADKPAFLAQADIAIFPSLGGESFGIVLLEAMAAGAGVVLGGDNPGYASVLASVPESLVSPKSARALAEQLELMLRDAELRKRLHKEQQKLVKQFDVAVVGARLVSVYRDAIAKRNSSSHNS